MLDVTLTATMHDGTVHEATPTAGAIIKAERHFKKPTGELFEGGSVEVMAWLCWETVRHSGTTVAPFDQWINALVGLDVDDGDDGPLDETA